jgi:hypothetical protein
VIRRNLAVRTLSLRNSHRYINKFIPQYIGLAVRKTYSNMVKKKFLIILEKYYASIFYSAEGAPITFFLHRAKLAKSCDIQNCEKFARIGGNA